MKHNSYFKVDKKYLKDKLCICMAWPQENKYAHCFCYSSNLYCENIKFYFICG